VNSSGALARPLAGKVDDRERLRLDHWALAGEWTIGAENVVLEQAGARRPCSVECVSERAHAER
jgi:hypothetical protein